jgi:hypothetical protein
MNYEADFAYSLGLAAKLQRFISLVYAPICKSVCIARLQLLHSDFSSIKVCRWGRLATRKC